MDLSPTTTVVELTRDKTWLGSAHGTDCTRTITLDIAGGTFATVLEEGGTIVPSGTPVVKGAGETYDLATGAGVVADGHLFEDVKVNADTTNAGGALLWHGVVVDAQVPGTFVDANRAKHILYV